MNSIQLNDEYIKRLLEVNDETKTDLEHRNIQLKFEGWRNGVQDSTGRSFNGDFYYMDKYPNIFESRPMCCGQFLDWKSEVE